MSEQSLVKKCPESDGLSAARAYAAWHLGYPDWADSIIDVYLNPAEAREALAIEMRDDDD